MAEQLVRPLGPEADAVARRQLRLHVGVTRPARAGQLDDELRRQGGGGPCEIRVDALLPPVRALGAKGVPLGAAQDADRLEVRRLEQDVRRRAGHFRLLAPHDPGERDRALRVRDHEIGGIELARHTVERRQPLLLRGPADDDAAAGERVEVERMQRVAEAEHDVVRHVDDVRDRAHACVADARLQPQRRRADRDVAEQAPDVARAAVRVVDADVDGLVVLHRRIGV